MLALPREHGLALSPADRATTADGGISVATTNTSCSLVIDELSEAEIAGSFTCQPNPDGYSATGSFDAAGS